MCVWVGEWCASVLSRVFCPVEKRQKRRRASSCEGGASGPKSLPATPRHAWNRSKTRRWWEWEWGCRSRRKLLLLRTAHGSQSQIASAHTSGIRRPDDGRSTRAIELPPACPANKTRTNAPQNPAGARRATLHVRLWIRILSVRWSGSGLWSIQSVASIESLLVSGRTTTRTANAPRRTSGRESASSQTSSSTSPRPPISYTHPTPQPSHTGPKNAHGSSALLPLIDTLIGSIGRLEEGADTARE